MKIRKETTLLLDLSKDEQYFTTYLAHGEEIPLKVSQVEVTNRYGNITVEVRGTHLHGKTGGSAKVLLDLIPQHVLVVVLRQLI